MTDKPLVFGLTFDSTDWTWSVFSRHGTVIKGGADDLREPGRSFMTPMMLLVERLGEMHEGNVGIVLNWQHPQ